MKRAMIALLAFALTGCMAPGATSTAEHDHLTHVPVYFGTYTRGKSKSRGIYRSVLDLRTGALSEPVLVTEAINPSFLALHPDGKHLYSVGEAGKFRGRTTGFVSAYAIDPESGTLTLMNQQASEGSGPCHLSVDASGRAVLVANYGGGSAASLPIDDSGKLQPAASAMQHEGSSVNPKRQEAPHAHSVRVEPSGRFAYVADLGLDKMVAYRFDSTSGKLTPAPEHDGQLAPGAGPRHFRFSEDGRFLYVLNELDSTITTFDFSSTRPAAIQTVPTLPADFAGTNTCAEIVIHPSGRFLYASNRGHDTLAIYNIAPGSGKLSFVGHQSTGGKTPRNFNIDPTGRFLIAANQNSDNLLVFEIDPASGKLTQVGPATALPSPVCVLFAPPAE